ncbi:RNA polymerase sigma-70 factor [Labilibaculum sp. DW002]|uniref:RNA polymerase sigma-70 factor n=1 Tax=Paralabilibaculum antarcticum TaxID=2912572 RepID=A0ABT5VNA6_9BACT|nr:MULTISPECIES: RNA polymerase sigma-70 factor [unclassified Labilibaculum]MBI9059277.1 RNA polymerase sigma-70 factor [Labilibaculum sp.]MDE5416930.1 RNA polymerase sigma-70 factor [Labilibaculum sp. DW002]
MKTHTENIKLLIKRLSEKSDERALDELFNIYYDKLLSSAFFVVKSKDLAEEVVSDVFYRLWQNREKLSEVKNLDNYLFVSVRNQSLNYINKEKRIPKDSIDEVISNKLTEGNTAEDFLVANELQNKINISIDKLPPKCKEVFLMIRFEGMKYKEVADRLKVSVNTVDTQMGIAIKKLTEMLGYKGKTKKK